MTGSPVPVGANPRAVAFGTVNGDATLDLVVVNYSANNVTILLRTTIFAPNGTTCDDGNACTLGETCGGGICANGTTITAPLEIQNVIVAGNKATYSWSAATYATQYDVVRGGTGALPVGPGGGDEVCFDNLSGTTLVDAAVPTPGTGFWYLSRGENACGIGTFGTRSNGSPRITTTCP